MTTQEIEQKIQALRKVMDQNPDNIDVIVHCGNKILDLQEQLINNKPVVYLPPK